MRHHNPGKLWKFKPAGLETSLDFGKYQKDVAILPIIGEPHVLGEELVSDTFAVGKNANGDYSILLRKKDNSSRLLLTAGVRGGFRGDVWIVEKLTTGNILKSCYAASKVDSEYRFAAVLERGQQIVITSVGRGEETLNVFALSNDGEYSYQTMSPDEWNATHLDEQEFKLI